MALPLTEGASATYTVKLSIAPSGGVQVQVASNDSTAVRVNKRGEPDPRFHGDGLEHRADDHGGQGGGC